MSDRMRPIPFAKLMSGALAEYEREGTLLGVYDLYRHTSGKTLPIFGETIETPFGPAAGPHSQLAQNLVAAYAGGARFFEVKTVQTLDGEDLPVSKPCILAQDEGYNVEWSTELTVPEAFDEYVKGWFAIKLLSRELALGSSDGFVFNMSVGYDLKGIQSAKIDRYIEGMRDAHRSNIFRECVDWTLAHLDKFRRVDAAFVAGLEGRICRSITLSTLHGCPPDEIERIATYLIEEKGLNTYIKCNPTLLGYLFARKTLDEMGYDYLVFDEHHFRNDLQFEDAIPMFNRLLGRAAKRGVEFGLKLTNTFPVTIARGELPGGEMYMSGRSLYPLSINLADRIEREFDGRLRVSYSGGADQDNIVRIFETGIWPITLATTLLKPGGYNRLRPMATLLAEQPYAPFTGVDLDKLGRLAADARSDPHHRKALKPLANRKLTEKVPLIDCFRASCESGCPIHQDIPTYLALVEAGRYDEALAVIAEKNPLPFITGTICSHRCQLKCTRNFYEDAVHIRDAKLVAAQNGYAALLASLKPGAANGVNVAIVGGGACGMSAAYFLAKAGAKATIFEKRDSLGGIVRHVIPSFRIAGDAIDKDQSLLDALGVEVRLNEVAPDAEALFAQGYTHVILAVGAWAHGALALAGEPALPVLPFLETLKKAPETLALGRSVAVIGGGNTAMDAARAAKRAQGVETVHLVYRRTIREMPAEEEELALALADGVRFAPLLAPISHENGLLTCAVMALGAPDASGRRRPEPTGEQVTLAADTVISAIGEQVDAKFLSENGVPLDARGRVASFEATPNLYVGGDALRGPATVVEAIADATEIVERILGVSPKDTPLDACPTSLKAKRSSLCEAGEPAREGARCLGCSVVCENCVDVCPNRANLAISVPGMAREQILHLDGRCNECGNCQAFCPYDSAPYREKWTLFDNRPDFDDSANEGYLPLGGTRVLTRFAGKVYEEDLNAPLSPAQLLPLMQAGLDWLSR